MLDGRSERLKNVPSRRGSLNFIHSFISIIFTLFICSYPLSFPHTHTLKQGALENKLRHREAEKGLESCVGVCRHPWACKVLCIWGSLCCVRTWVWDVCTHRVWVWISALIRRHSRQFTLSQPCEHAGRREPSIARNRVPPEPDYQHPDPHTFSLQNSEKIHFSYLSHLGYGI